jgi:drug/metabolite transporter (DMT)-like permease
MPIGTSVSLRYTSPFFAALLAMIFLGERMQGLQWFFFSMAFVGVVMLKGVDLRISIDAFLVSAY